MKMLLEEIREIDIVIRTALNGQFAIQEVNHSQRGVSFSHIFLDLHMPIMDGYKVKSRCC